LCFHLFKLVPYSHYSEHNGDGSPKDENRGLIKGLAFNDVRINRLTPNDPYMGRTAPLTSKRCMLYIYSTNIGT